jgi:ABC-type lipoprotein export system ATPase subunit
LFQGLSFRLSPGQITGICGPSGCGKSTLLSILAGWEVPRRGAIRRVGIRSVGWVFQNPYGVPERSALDHVIFPLLAQGQSRQQAEPSALALMDRFGLSELAQRPFAALSGGEAQRLMLARAVAAAPDLLLVDEPTAQLDLQTARSVNASLGHIASGGAIVAIATHDPVTRSVCHQVIDLTATTATVMVNQPGADFGQPPERVAGSPSYPVGLNGPLPGPLLGQHQGIASNGAVDLAPVQP